MNTKQLLSAIQNNDRNQLSQLFPSKQRKSNIASVFFNSKTYKIKANNTSQQQGQISNQSLPDVIKITEPNFISQLEFNNSTDQAIYWLIKNKKPTQVLVQKNYKINKSLFFYACSKGEDKIINLFINQIQSSKNGIYNDLYILELGLSVATQYKQATIMNLLSNYLNGIPNKSNPNVDRPLEIQFLTACQNKQIDFIKVLLSTNNNIHLFCEGLELLIENKAKDSDILDIYKKYYLPTIKKEDVLSILKTIIKSKNINLFEQIFKTIRNNKNIMDDKFLTDIIKSVITNKFTQVFKQINFLAHLTEKQIMDAHMQVINNFSMANKFLSSQGNSNQYQLKEQYFIYSIKQFKKLKMLSSSNIIKLFLIVARRGLSNLIELGFNSKLLNINSFNKSLINNNCELLRKYNDNEIINFITHRLDLKLTQQQLNILRPFNLNLVKAIEKRDLFHSLHINLKQNKPKTEKLLKI